MMEKRSTLRNRLILAGIDVLNRNGTENFSLRQVAEECGVSCAAPYRHFRDKRGFISAILDYTNGIWRMEQENIQRQFPGDLRRQIVEICAHYICFLKSNPYFRVIILATDAKSTQEYGPKPLLGRMSEITREVVAQYCDSVGMPPEIRERKTCLLYSVVYGAAIMFDTGEAEDSDRMLRYLAQSIDREFDLP